jgi:hypothetical protein
MKTSSKSALGIAALLVLALIVVILLHLPGPSDTDQILAQLESARVAAQRHDVSGIMKIVSANYHGNTDLDANGDQLHFLLIHFVGQTDDPVQVTLSPPGVQIHGSTAETLGQILVRSSQDSSVLYSGPLDLTWKQENGTKWLVFPAKVWRVTGAQFTAPEGGE